MDEPPLHLLLNRAGHPTQIKRLIVAYSRAPNLGNIVSCRKIQTNLNLTTTTNKPLPP
jgi:hypothetical protein